MWKSVICASVFASAIVSHGSVGLDADVLVASGETAGGLRERNIVCSRRWSVHRRDVVEEGWRVCRKEDRCRFRLTYGKFVFEVVGVRSVFRVACPLSELGLCRARSVSWVCPNAGRLVACRFG